MSPFRHNFFDVDRFTEVCCSAQIPLSENRQAKLPISTDHVILRGGEGSLCLCIGGTRMVRKPSTTVFGNLCRLARRNCLQLCGGVMAKTPCKRVAIPFWASVFCSHSERRFLNCVEIVRLKATFLMGKYAGFYEVTFFSEPIPCTSVLFRGVYLYIAFAH